MKMGQYTKWITKNIVWLMFGGVILLFLLNFSMVFFVSDKDTRGTFGDQFGAVNALFSGLAFTGLIYTIILQRRDLAIQRRDLQLQRKELELTRGELQNQTEQYTIQNKTLAVQRFENTFFQMLTLHHEIVNGLSFQYIDRKYSGRGVSFETTETMAHGREVFGVAYNYSTSSGWGINKSMSALIKKKGIAGYNDSYIPVLFDHYFRNLYRIIKFTDDSKLIDDLEKNEYIDILRAQLSPYELVWLYYNGLSAGKERMKSYIQTYSLLNNIRRDLLVDTTEFIGEYEDKAFQ